MSSTNKYRILFFAICFFIGLAIYLNSGKPTEDLDSKVLNIENIKEVEIKRVSDDKIIILSDSNLYKPLIDDLLSSKKTKIKDPRSARTDFYIKIFLLGGKTVLIGFEESKREGKFIWVNSFRYKNDLLYDELSQKQFY